MCEDVKSFDNGEDYSRDEIENNLKAVNMIDAFRSSGLLYSSLFSF
jgi:hypothetical protein